MYFSYHAKIKKLIFEGKLTGYEFCENYHGICPALILFFKDSPPMPIRDYRWEEYVPILIKLSDKLEDFSPEKSGLFLKK